MRKALHPLLVLCTLASLFFFAQAFADNASEGERKNLARVLYTEGVKLQEQGKYAEALTKLEAAQKQYQAATHLLHMAECQAMLGQLVDASENYRQLARMNLGDNAQDAFKSAQQQGAGELTALEPRIPVVRIDVKDPPQATLKNLQITLNEKPFPVELLGIARPIDPGKYRLQATADGWVLKDPKEIVVVEREKKAVALTFEAGGPALVVPPLPSGSASSAPTTAPTTSSTAPTPEPPKEKKFGILAGAHLGYVDPRGEIARYVGSGAGLGVDFGLKLQRAIYLGANFEYGLYGTGRDINAKGITRPEDPRVSQGNPDKYSAYGYKLGLSFGFFTSNDKLSFWGDFTGGIRTFTIRYDGDGLRDFTWAGFDVGLGAGAMIPVGPMRIVPRVGYDIGLHATDGPSIDINGKQTTASGCKGDPILGLGGGNCTLSNSNAGSYGVLNLGVIVFFNSDLF